MERRPAEPSSDGMMSSMGMQGSLFDKTRVGHCDRARRSRGSGGDVTKFGGGGGRLGHGEGGRRLGGIDEAAATATVHCRLAQRLCFE